MERFTESVSVSQVEDFTVVIKLTCVMFSKLLRQLESRMYQIIGMSVVSFIRGNDLFPSFSWSVKKETQPQTCGLELKNSCFHCTFLRKF